MGGFDPSAINLTTTSRLDMSSAPGVWEAGPTFTPQRADFGLAYDGGTNKLYTLGGDLGNDGNFFNSTNLVDELDVGSWPGGTWSSSPPNLPTPNRQANQAGFYGGGDIWSVGGINGATFQFLAEVYHRPNGGPTPTPTPTPCPGDQYTIAEGTDPIVPGDTDIGSHCDDCDTVVALPFSFQLYGNTYNSVNVSSNGRLDFVTPNEPGGYVTNCLPAPANIGPYDYTIFPTWEDMRTDLGLSGCAAFPGGTCGIFTSVSGTAPNRVFNIEWRTVLFANNASTQNFEARLYENDPNRRFDVIIGTLNTAGADHNYVSGVQGDANTGFFTEDFCTLTPPQNVSRTYTAEGCETPTPTPTPGQIMLRASGHRVNHGQLLVSLKWRGANSARIDVYRDGAPVARVENNGGPYNDLLTRPALYTYKVCEAHTMNCSNQVRVTFNPQ